MMSFIIRKIVFTKAESQLSATFFSKTLDADRTIDEKSTYQHVDLKAENPQQIQVQDFHFKWKVIYH